MVNAGWRKTVLAIVVIGVVFAGFVVAGERNLGGLVAAVLVVLAAVRNGKGGGRHV